jgi:trimeric autotransporter adhesin
MGISGKKDKIIKKTIRVEDDCYYESNSSFEPTGKTIPRQACGASATGKCSHAEGDSTVASGDSSHAEGQLTSASQRASHSEGNGTSAEGFASHAEGQNSTAHGDADHAEGFQTYAAGFASHAEGSDTETSGEASHAEGFQTKALNQAAHSEGFQTKSSGLAAHTEGYLTQAKGNSSHAEGSGTLALGINSHSEGFQTQATGNNSHSEGRRTIASGLNSHAEGHGTSTNLLEGAHIMGKFGSATNPYSWHLANGMDANNKSLAAKIRNDGTGIADRVWVTGNADFAEMFETLDGKTIEPGYFVTLEGEKIRKASSNDNYILGVTNSNPGFLADSAELRWKDKYVTDEWGNIIYKEVIIPAVKGKNGEIIASERRVMQPVLNSKWSNKKEYIPRSQRPEWVPVTLMGKVLVRDDGTCKVNGSCIPNNEGIATANKRGYRVLKRLGKNQILILIINMVEII